MIYMSNVPLLSKRILSETLMFCFCFNVDVVVSIWSVSSSLFVY